MTNESTKRAYRMRRRAELQEQTRLRITEAAVELHGTLGPARTSVTAVAERAGVERATVYRHFPDERSLFLACSGHWRAANPAPDPGAWAAIPDPDVRLREALDRALRVLRADGADAGQPAARRGGRPDGGRAHGGGVPSVRRRAGRRPHARAPERGRARRDVRAALGHAVAFTTWSSLVRAEGLDDAGGGAADVRPRGAAGAPAGHARRSDAP